jgi:hypothetical protein
LGKNRPEFSISEFSIEKKKCIARRRKIKQWFIFCCGVLMQLCRLVGRIFTNNYASFASFMKKTKLTEFSYVVNTANIFPNERRPQQRWEVGERLTFWI